MLDQILKFIVPFVVIDNITWFITYNLGTAIASINKEECDEANEWKFRYHILLLFFSIILSIITVKGG